MVGKLPKLETWSGPALRALFRPSIEILGSGQRGGLQPRQVCTMVTANNNAFPLTEIDRQILAMKDEDFHLIKWQELKEIIGTIMHHSILSCVC